MTFRETAPSTRAIESLNYTSATREILAGGLPMYVCPPRPLGVLKLQFYWPTGTAQQPAPMVARATNILRLSGNKHLTSEQIQEGFEYLGASVGMDVGLNESTLTLQAQEETLIEALQWLLKEGQDPVFPDEELAIYKQVETAGLLRRMQTPRYWSSRECMESLYGIGSPDGTFSNPEDIEALQAATLQYWFTTNLGLGMSTVFVSGDANAKLQEKLRQVLGGINTQEQAPTIITTNTQGLKNQVIKHPLEQSSQASMYLARTLPEMDMRTLQLASLVNMFLGGFFGSRLMQDLRETRGLTYGIGSGISPSSNGYTWYVSGEMNSSNADAALEATLEIMKNIASNPPSGDELDKAKRYAAGQMRAGFDGPFALPRKIQFLLQRGFDEQYYTSYMDTLWSISSEEISQFADNYLQPEAFTIALAGKLN